MDLNKNVHPTVAWSLVCGLAIAVLLLIFLQLGETAQLTSQSKKSIPLSEEAVVVLDFGNGKVRRFKGPIFGNEKVWDAFQQAVAAGGINVETTNSFVPENIDGHKNEENGKRWNLYLNNVRQRLAPFEIPVKPGDEVVFKYE